MNWKTYFKDKKITVMGLGLLGRGIGVIKFLAEQGAILTVTDLKTKEQLAPAFKQLGKYKNITYVLGEHRLEDFKNKDLIIRAPNAPLDSVYLKEAEKNKIEVDQDASLFCRLAPEGVKIIGITGTRGKSTVTHLLYDILKAALRQSSGHPKRQIFLGGNVRGTATLPLLKKIKKDDYVVMELDSWQLQSFTTFSPHLAIFTTFMNDHQNYYRNSMDQYFADKANIFTHQTKDDVLIVGSQVASKIKLAKPKAKLIVPKQSLLQGKHREYNAAIAGAAAKALGVSDSVIKKAVKNFKGLPGRLELIAIKQGTRPAKGGVKYYNDTTATTPDAVMAAVHALKDYKGKIILVGGGADKELDFKRYGQIVSKYLKELILFKGTATDKLLNVLPSKFKKQAVLVDNMKDAFKCATALANKGDLVLLSPGAASFGIFKNEFDRGDQFVKLVKKLK